MSWIVVVTGAMQERVVVNRLCSRAIVAVCPVEEREWRHARRVERRSYPLYSRYVFAMIDEYDDMALSAVSGTSGVRDILRKAGSIYPATVDDRLVAIVSRRDEVVWPPGARLRVCGGRWIGVEGLFARREADRVTMLLSLLGRQVEYDFYVNEVELVSA